MRRLIVLRVNDNQNLLGSDRLPPRYLGNRRGRRTVLHSLLTLLPRFARDAVVRGWIRFISAFPARRLVPALNQKLNVSGLEASRVSQCINVYLDPPLQKDNLE